ncbi:MAG: hypothetical protein R2695_06365 [Acidimicrobiales bacterium]
MAIAGLLIAGITLTLVLTRADPGPDAAPLPPPASFVPSPIVTADGRPPSIDGPGTTEVDVVTPGAPREVGNGLAPWQTAPPVDIVTGEPLDPRLDFGADIAATRRRVEAFARDSGRWSITVPVDAEITTPTGTTDRELAEQTQPFAARRLADDAGTGIGDVWVLASGGSDAGDRYLAEARRRWSPTKAIETHSPSVGLRLSLIYENEAHRIWVVDLDGDSILVFDMPATTDVTTLADVTAAWRAAIDG